MSRPFRRLKVGASKGIQPSMVTNGSPLTPRNLEKLKRSGLKTMFISIEAAEVISPGMEPDFSMVTQSMIFVPTRL